MHTQRHRGMLTAAILLSANGLAGAWPDLHDNGPFITSPGGGFGGAPLSAIQTPTGNNAAGFIHQMIPAGARLADDFAVPAGAAWTVTSVVVYAFQTNSGTVASPFTHANLRIWSGRPGDAGSVVLFGDTTTNRLVSSAWTGAYRARDTTPLDTTRPIFINEIAVSPPLVLGPGTYWADFQESGTLSSGPWSVPVTIPGLPGAPGANARVFMDGAWADLRETNNNTPQDVTFIVRGTATGGGGPACYANCDGSSTIPFLNVNDFVCFQQRFAAGSPQANCDGSTSAPLLNVDDFVCFQQRFAAGCSAP